jgi:hypothetical protein
LANESDDDDVDIDSDDGFDNEDDESSNVTVGSDLKASTISKCVAVAKMLIRSPRLNHPVNAKWVSKSFWTPDESLNDGHHNFIAKIVNLLRPFYPRDIQKNTPAPRHILLSVNMVMLANFVLTKLGYKVILIVKTLNVVGID